MYQSTEMQERTEKTFEKNLVKETEKVRKSLTQPTSLEFACEPDARDASQRWIQKQPLFRFIDLRIGTVIHRVNRKRGRPAIDESCITRYIIESELVPNEEAIANAKEKLGRFILATNDLTLNPDDLLAYYKGQGAVEQGFRFLKDKSFRIAAIFLKKPSRIQALAVIMVLCLFLFSLTEYRLRKKLKETGEFVLSQIKKLTQNPTLKWIFFKFRGVIEFKIRINNTEISRIGNMKPELAKIVSLLGASYEKYYF